ncbi:MAG: ribosome biogenesis GTP-binding protein YihA/YsxC [Clostridiales bacterium]|nr:ribosome biogenesis GTP-binding protein YihA/YsxC [Clostridiales bacterium]
MNLHNAEYVRSAGIPRDFLHDHKPQFAMAGRSNVGKSSVINRMLDRKNLARVGNSPGKTRQVNYFLIDNSFYLVDLPGYGYAKVTREEKQRWSQLMEAYFADGQITLGLLIVDARHKPSKDDVVMANWFKETGCPFAVVANKLDKLKKSEIQPNLALIRETLELGEDVPLIPFSAEKGDGKQALVSLVLNTMTKK